MQDTTPTPDKKPFPFAAFMLAVLADMGLEEQFSPQGKRELAKYRRFVKAEERKKAQKAKKNATKKKPKTQEES